MKNSLLTRIWIFALLILLPLQSRAETLQTAFLMAGTRYQTPYFIKSGGEIGPTIVVIGGLHGDEKAGYLAARELRNWTITRGKLVLVTDAHIEAIRRDVRAYPRNMNRLFPGKKDGDAMEKLAFGIWQLIVKSKPDLVLTLHESRGFHADEPARYGQTFTYDFEELEPRFKKVAARVNAGISPRKHRFLQFVAPFPTCPTYVTWKYLRVPAASVETARTLPLKLRTGYQLAAVRGFFDDFRLGYSAKSQEGASPALAPS